MSANLLTLMGSGKAKGTSWTPPQKSGLLTWVKASSESYANNATATTGHDQSGNGNNWTLTGTVTFKTSQVNGLPAFQFDGTTGFYSCNALGSTLSGSGTPFTFAALCKLGTLGALHQCYFILANQGGGDSATPTHDLFYRDESGNLWSDRRADSAAITSAFQWTPDTNYHAIVYSYDGSGNATLYIDGTLYYTTALGTGALTSNGLVVGAHARATVNDSFFGGQMEEWMFYSTASSAADAANLSAYLRQRGNVTAGGSLAWTPYQLSGVEAFWNETSWNFQSDGATPSTWYTKVTGDSRTFYDITATATTYKTNIRNGLAAALLDGSTSYLAADALASAFVSGTAQPWTVFGSFQDTDNGATAALFDFAKSDSATPVHVQYLDSLTSPVVQTTGPDSVDGGSNTKTTGAFASNTTNGNAIIAVVWDQGDTPNATVSSVTDNKGNTYTQDLTHIAANGYDRCSFWRCNSISGGSGHTVTATLSTTGYITVSALEVTGLAASPLDGSGSGNDGINNVTATPSPGSFSTANATDWILLSFAAGSMTNSPAVPSGYTQHIIQNTGSHEEGVCCSKVVQSTQSGINPTFGAISPSNTAKWSCVAQPYKLSSVSGAAYDVIRRNDASTLVEQTAGTTDTNWHYFIASYDGSAYTLVIDGTTLMNGVSLTANTMTVNQFTIGCLRKNGSNQQFMPGYFGELGFAKQATTGSDLTSLETYLSRWS